MDKIMTDTEWRMISADSRAKINVYSMNKEREISALRDCLRIAMEALTFYAVSDEFAQEAIANIINRSFE